MAINVIDKTQFDKTLYVYTYTNDMWATIADAAEAIFSYKYNRISEKLIKMS